jgi:HK97 family phage prohead protease
MSEELKKRLMKNGIRFEVKDADKGLVEAVFCRFNVKDYDGDWIVPEAFEDGADVLISAYGHTTWRGERPVGRGKIRVDKAQGVAILDGQFWLETEDGRETFMVVKNAAELQEWSFGFDVLSTGVVTEEMRQAGVWRVITKVQVYEVSPVMVGAGVDTETLSVKGKPPVAAPSADEVPRAAVMTELARFEKTRARLAG